MSLPPRSSSIPETTLMVFDVSCGDALVPGHSVIARGLADGGRSRDDLSSGDQSLHDECQMVDLVYEIVPGVTPTERPADRSQPFTVDATYGADVGLSWSTGGSGPGGLGGPCWVEDYQGGESTLGGLGPWPVPDGARQLTFWLHAADNFTCRGSLQVDLNRQTASWVPAEATSL